MSNVKIMNSLKSVRAVRTFTYDPEPFLEMYAGDADADVSQEAFEAYVAECAIEDFDAGGGSFEILPCEEDEESNRLQEMVDAICVWEWYIEESKVHLLPDEGVYAKRQLVIEHITPAVDDVWETFERLTGSHYPDSFDWEFVPEVLSAWHDKGAEEFMRLVSDRDVRIAWLGGFIEEVKEKEKRLKWKFDEGKD